MLLPIAQRIATELEIRFAQAQAAISLLDEGASVPFIARYRKEATGALDDGQLRKLDERLRYLRELDARRETVIASITEQNKMTDELLAELWAADNKTRLEDLYLPYKPKRRTKAQIAREAGLAPLAEQLLADPNLVPEMQALNFLNPEHQILDCKTALDGARAILIEQFAEDASLLGQLREGLWATGEISTKVIEGKEGEGAKYADYFAYREPLKSLPSHRVLAILRGRNEGILSLTLHEQDAVQELNPSIFEHKIAQKFNISQQNRPADAWLLQCVRLCWRAKLLVSLELELLNRARENAETAAIKVFAQNLHDLLLASPAGARVTMGLDPGIRTGVKVAVVDATGKLLDTTTIYPHEPRREWQVSMSTLCALIERYRVELIAIGNGTASRETDQLVADVLKQLPKSHSVQKIIVSEAGASVYSASELAAVEFPELDVSLRGAVSIARRLQDPLAELVKIDPKSIGVGQYQHDLNQTQLAHSLDAVVEDCVNAVGVDVNTASVSLLSRISGLNKTLAQNIVAWRDQHGAFSHRKQLLNVPRLGEKTFEQAAGFLRILNGKEPLDASAVHPEAYPVVEKILAAVKKPIGEVIGNRALLSQLSPEKFTDERFGLPTVEDILKELDKPARDPRPEFKTAKFAENIHEIKDLKEGMILEGVVSNVVNFGAFVDIGVHQDGLIHISELADKFVSDPREIVRAGDIVRVKVIELDLVRKRVALSMRLGNVHETATVSKSSKSSKSPKVQKKPQTHTPENAMAAAFAKLTR